MRGFALLMLLWIAGMSPAWANRDSVGVKQVNNKWFIIHKVDKGMGLFTIAKHYGVSMQDISHYNPDVAKGLYPGQTLLIPYDKPVSAGTVTTRSITPTPKPKPAPQTMESVSVPPKAAEPHYHTVQPGETLYRISVAYKVSVDKLREWNKMTDNSINAGQSLIVGYTVGAENTTAAAKTNNIPGNVAIEPTTPANQTASISKDILTVDEPEMPVAEEHIDESLQQDYDAFQKKLEASRKKGKVEIKEVEETSIATAIDDGSIISEKSLALHRTAPPGTIIKLTNPMNGSSVFVKVIGKMPNDITEQNVAIKITKTAADRLGVKDKYFRLETHYSMEVIKK